MTTIEVVRELALSLPRSYEALVRDEVRFRVGQIVYLGFSRDETLMGFAFPKEEREALVASEPHKFQMPRRSALRYNWVVARLDAIDDVEIKEIVVEAWRMVVPKRVAQGHLDEREVSDARKPSDEGQEMGSLIAYSVPVLPGQSDRVRDFERELSAVRDRYDELNGAATVTRHAVFLQSSPEGDVAIHIMEVNDPSRFLRAFDDSAYDRWWLDYMRDVHGVDLRKFPPPPPPEPVFDSSL